MAFSTLILSLIGVSPVVSASYTHSYMIRNHVPADLVLTVPVNWTDGGANPKYITPITAAPAQPGGETLIPDAFVTEGDSGTNTMSGSFTYSVKDHPEYYCTVHYSNAETGGNFNNYWSDGATFSSPLKGFGCWVQHNYNDDEVVFQCLNYPLNNPAVCGFN